MVVMGEVAVYYELGAPVEIQLLLEPGLFLEEWWFRADGDFPAHETTRHILPR